MNAVRLKLFSCVLLSSLLLGCSTATENPSHPKAAPSPNQTLTRDDGERSDRDRDRRPVRTPGRNKIATRTGGDSPEDRKHDLKPAQPERSEDSSSTTARAPDRRRVRVAATLPSGDEELFDGRRMVALYGTPGTPSLGALGEQSLDQTVRRARTLARRYDAHTRDDVLPAFELIASIASTSAGDDGDFSTELPVAKLRPWVERAAREGIYVVLDLQPGRSDFRTQAKRYAPLLRYPHVGLALDPEWRLGPKQHHLEQIGSVDAAEVNRTLAWLDAFTERENLPRKLVVLHQFRMDMITDRRHVRTDHDNLTVLIHADGQGSQRDKRATWRTLHTLAPDGVRWGWKNFLDEDRPTLTPKQTYQVRPRPDFVSYQ